MEYEVGQEVELLQNLGPRAGRAVNRYFHGGTVGETPLLQHAKVIKIVSPEEILVKVSANCGCGGCRKEWYVHPDELKPEDPRIARYERVALPGIESLEKHPIFEMAQENNVFVVGDTVYVAGEKKVKEGDYFSIKGGKYGLIQAGDISSLDELMFAREAPALEELKKKFAGKIQQEIKGMNFTNLDAPQLMYKQLFSYLRANGEYQGKLGALVGMVAEMPGEEKEHGKQATEEFEKLNATKTLQRAAARIEDYVASLIKDLHKDEKERSKKDSILDFLFGFVEREKQDSIFANALGMDAAFIDEEVYPLVAEGTGRHIMVDGRKLYLEERCKTVPETNMDFLTELGKNIRVATLEQYFTKENITAMVADENAELITFAGLQTYAEEDFGFLPYRDSYLAFIEVPTFAIKSQFDDRHYLFNKSRLGIQVWADEGELDYSDSLIMIDNNNHPFNHNKIGDYVDVCVGRQSFPTTGENKSEVISKRLRRGKEMLMFGYAKGSGGYDPCYELQKTCRRCEVPHFSKNLADEKKLRKLKIPIIQGGPR
jgi:thiol-disulfide isomerase/thioredoxin